MFTYILAVAAVPTDASQAAVDHLDGTEYKLQCTHGEQNGEQNDVPHHNIFGIDTHCPQGLVNKVAAIPPAREDTSRE